jgi:hypothetical protein
MTVTPAYGRDYKSAKAAKADWEAGKDFIVADISDPYCGKPINIADAKGAGIATINIRYAATTKVTVVTID